MAFTKFIIFLHYMAKFGIFFREWLKKFVIYLLHLLSKLAIFPAKLLFKYRDFWDSFTNFAICPLRDIWRVSRFFQQHLTNFMIFCETIWRFLQSPQIIWRISRFLPVIIWRITRFFSPRSLKKFVIFSRNWLLRLVKLLCSWLMEFSIFFWGGG